MVAWNNKIHRAMAHPIKRRVIELLRKKDLSFTKLLIMVGESDHGKFGYHLRTLKTFVEFEPSNGKYRLTKRGKVLAACIQDFQFIIATSRRLKKYVQGLSLGTHAAGFYDTEKHKQEMVFPFLDSGISKREAIVYLVSEDKLDLETQEIRKYGIDLDLLSKGKFQVLSAEEWYLRKGRTQTKIIIANWLNLLKASQKAGFMGLRFSGETEVFFDYGKTKELLRYEKALSRNFSMTMVALCLYNLNRLEEERFTQVCKCHRHFASSGLFGKMTA